MNIGIDISLLKINLAGMGIYVKEMVEYFSALDQKNNYFLFTNADIACELNISKRFTVIKTEIKPHILWLRFKMPQLLKKYKIDIFWQPDHILPPKVKNVDYYVTVHDLSAYKYRNVAMKRVEVVYKTFLKKTCKEAKKIIAISNYTKRDIIETLKINSKKIVVIYNGDSPYKKKDGPQEGQITECMGKYGVSKPYFLFVGTINPRKNVWTIIKAFNNFRDRNVCECQLVIVGEYGWNSENVLEEIECSHYKKDIIVTGFVSELEKEIFYRNAQACIFPSILEGFGLPVIEAMSVGIPTILSNVSSLPEVGGDASFYLNDLYSHTEMADKMEDIVNLSVEEKKRIKDKCYKQAELFSRKKCAVETLKLFERGTNN